MTTILIISPEPWEGHFVSKHHYAMELARRGHDVLFYGPPDSTDSIRLKSVADVQGNLWVLYSPRVAPGLRFFPSFIRKSLEARWLRDVEKVFGRDIDVVWSFENSRFFDMGFAGERLKIYHQVDLNQDFYPYLAARSADACFCTTDIIRERLLSQRQDVWKIHHGTAISDSESVDCLESESFNVKKINAMYIGNLDMAYIDVDSISRLVIGHPDVMFHFIGGYRDRTPLFEQCGLASNTKFWGRVSFQLLPEFLKRADVLLVVYRSDRQRDQASPHKFMEYLLSGKVIVCTYTDEYKDKQNIVEMASPEEEIDMRFSRVVSNLEEYNSPARVLERKKFAIDNTYKRQIDRIAKALGPRGILIL